MTAPSISPAEISEFPLTGPEPIRRPFVAPRTKIERAKTVLGELSQAIDSFLAEHPPKVRVEIQEPRGARPKVFFHVEAKGAPEMIGAIMGDVIHNLRSALDLVACELARAAGHSDKGVYFPFCDRPEALEKTIKDRRFDRAGPEAVALLRELKPYPSGNAALRAIHDLDIKDKHQMLLPTFTAFASPILSRWDDDGTLNLTVVGDPDLATDVRLVLPDGPLGGDEILPALHSLADLASGVVEAFCALTSK